MVNKLIIRYDEDSTINIDQIIKQFEEEDIIFLPRSCSTEMVSYDELAPTRRRVQNIHDKK